MTSLGWSTRSQPLAGQLPEPVEGATGGRNR